MLTELITQLSLDISASMCTRTVIGSSLLDEIDAYGLRLLILFGCDPQVLATAETAVVTHPDLSHPAIGACV